MNKKKAIKVVAASAIAASAFAAVAPTQSQAATSVATTVTNAQKAMKAPFDKYYQTGTTKKTVSAATVQALITKGEKAYADATAVVKKSGGKSAKTYQAKLDGYKKYLDRSKAYVAGLGSIFKVYGNADAALKANKVADLEKAQAELKDPKNQGHVGIGKIYGPVVREVLTGAFDRLSKVRLDKIEAALEALATPKVDSVSAINATSVKLEGSSLDKLKADNFSVVGNKVVNYSVDKETGVATLTFENKFESAKEQTLKLTEKVEGEADKVTETKFTYTLEVKSVVANALTVDNDTAGQKLTFKLNDEAVDADTEYLKASGYNVEFQATGNVFVGGTSSSNTGELAASLTDGFAYKIVITDKDGKVVAESALTQVKVADKSAAVTAIDSFDVSDANIKLTSNTIVLGESFTIDNIVGDKADGTKDTDITSLVEFSSSNKNVAIVDSTGAILPINTGKTTITVKSGDVTKSFELTVSGDARVAKTATLSKSSLKLVENGSTASVGVVVKDQYGDAVKGLDLSDDVTYDTTKVTVNNVATDIVDVTGTTTDAEGKASLTVSPVATGSGSVKVKVGTTQIASFSASVSKDTAVASRKLELVDGSKDLNLDVYDTEVDDKSVALVYNKYNANGYLLGNETTDLDDTAGTKYTVSVEEATGKDIIDAVVANGEITVTAKADAGTAYVVIKEGSITREKLAVTVKNSTPKVSAVTLKTADKVITAGTDITASSVINLKTEANKDSLVQNVSLSSPSKFAVRLDETTGSLYLDADNDGTLDNTELEVGSVTVTENITAAPSGTTIATTAGDNGSVVYSVKDSTGKVIATSVVDVEVPAAN